MSRFRVGILGATGLVGQRLIERLRDHPWFELAAVAASARSAGQPYGEVARWALESELPREVARLSVRDCAAGELSDCELLLSALDAAPAREIEPALRAAGFAVVSNSSAQRMEADVPLVVPEVNAAHLALVEPQRRRHGRGFIVTNPNCSAIGLALGIAPLHAAYEVRRVVVSTMQAVSGAGLAGPSALELIDNVLPHVPGEEEKIESEIPKIFGAVAGGTVRPAGMMVSAHCHRVAVRDGHLESVSLELGCEVAPDDALETLSGFVPEAEIRALPSAVSRPIEVRLAPDRPQPRLDRDAAGGMAVVLGRVRRCPVLGLKLELLSHNAIRGAAGGTLLLAELLAARGLLPARGRA